MGERVRSGLCVSCDLEALTLNAGQVLLFNYIGTCIAILALLQGTLCTELFSLLLHTKNVFFYLFHLRSKCWVRRSQTHEAVTW